jgi:hypothetical protein
VHLFHHLQYSVTHNTCPAPLFVNFLGFKGQGGGIKEYILTHVIISTMGVMHNITFLNTTIFLAYFQGEELPGKVDKFAHLFSFEK